MAFGVGCLVTPTERNPKSHVFKWTNTTLFQFDAASKGNLAVLANTAYSSGTVELNNTRFVISRRGADSPCMKVSSFSPKVWKFT